MEAAGAGIPGNGGLIMFVVLRRSMPRVAELLALAQGIHTIELESHGVTSQRVVAGNTNAMLIGCRVVMNNLSYSQGGDCQGFAQEIEKYRYLGDN